ncbi:hypothetical protein [Leptospira sarikeiensis]|uniref:Lipoprotein n=1 Tax=Leptospira sarikeiensis TaxID=2484943 RepID=A0A4R9KDK6_9LEPT|nr:hypothetical protein [Leptospira sarikeiensis]TGL63253.1 hypothetical protein EHQ64_04625 [Leptospira sarikeiensis]
MKKIGLIIVACSAIGLFNCATFTSYPDGFKDPTYAKPEKASNKTISVTYTQKSFSENGQEIQVNAAALEALQKELEKNVSESGYFKAIATALEPSDLKLQIEGVDQGGGGGQALAFISGLTLTILPAWAKDTFTITYTFKDKKDKVVKQYVRSVTFNTWIQILLIFVFPFQSPGKEIPAGFKATTYSVLEEAAKDGIYNLK